MYALLKDPITVALLSVYLFYYLFRWYRLRKAMPPGPLGIPFIGNKHQLSSMKPWKKFAEWNAEYGPVTSILLGSNPVIILGTAQATWDLLERRSEIYSSRPRSIIAGEILSDNKRGLLLPYGDTWRRWRRVLHSAFNAKKTETYNDIQSFESKVLLKEILECPKDYERHTQRFAASLVVSVTYGKRINSVDEWLLKRTWTLLTVNLFSVNIPGKYIVESWPWLLKLPRSLQWFRHQHEVRKQRDIHFLTHLVDDVKKRMANGTIPDCMTVQAITNIKQLGMEGLDLAYAVSSPFGAGIETTSGSICSFIYIQEKARAELDRVVGQDRMPDFEDRDNLPYIQAIVKETLRWRPVAVLGGAPHATTADDSYNGMAFDAESRYESGIMKDPAMFPDPESFSPERFIETTNPRLKHFDLPFGFGRRACPGIHLALNALFINISRILWAFEIHPAVDEYGNKVLPDVNNYTSRLSSGPVSFDCHMMPRNEKIKACIEAEWEATKVHLAHWES